MYRRTRRFQKSGKRDPFSEIPFHSSETKTEMKEKGDEFVLRLCAIDPAIKNCAIRIEDRIFSVKDDYKSLKGVETIVQDKFDFVTGEDGSNYWKKLYTSFDKYLTELDECHYILIESQLPVNTEMVRVSQAIITYLHIYLFDKGVKPIVVEVDASLKTKMLGCVGRKTKPERKKWCIEKGGELLKERGDVQTIDFLKKQRKKDDHYDVICFCESWYIILKDGGVLHPIKTKK